ncbi:MAG: thioredoxin-disulfide reductase [Candidatus Cloacimonadota bacterium]|nr:thioredoxin-disulfide reductase [Candidatus Cloacimonadota bacterium]
MYDVIILGGGPAGLTAGLYAARYKLKTLLLEKQYLLGGSMLDTWAIENYPGFEKPINGLELSEKMHKQAEIAGLEIISENVIEVDLKGEVKRFKTDDESEYSAKTAIICTGSSPSKLNIPGEDEFRGKGVSYCGTCDAPFFKERVVAVVGGGNTAVSEAMYLSKYASKVYLIHRRNKLRADKVMSDRAKNNEKIEILWNSTVQKINFHNFSDKHIIIWNNLEKSESKLKATGIFIFVGIKPNNEMLNNQIELTEYGFIDADEKTLQTNIDKVYAAGDIRNKNLRQIVTAAGDGAITAYEINTLLNEY